MIAWAVGINIITLIVSLPLAFLAWVGVAMGTADAAFTGVQAAPLTAIDIFEVLGSVIGLFALGTIPSWVLIYFRKPFPALLSSMPACLAGLALFMLLGRAFR